MNDNIFYSNVQSSLANTNPIVQSPLNPNMLESIFILDYNIYIFY